jgi:hypothetical protein
MIPCTFPTALLIFITTLVPTVFSQDLSQSQENLVISSLAQGANQSYADFFLSPLLRSWVLNLFPNSWELGTRSLALLSLDVPPYSPFNPKQSLPPPSKIPSNVNSDLQPVIQIAQSTVSASLADPNTSLPRPLVRTGAVGDSASIGTAVLIANWTHQPGLDYNDAAEQQLAFLYSDNVAKTPDGAWSHRPEQLQLW